MLITALLLSVALTAPQASDDPADPRDGVIATAPATPVVLDATAGPTPPPLAAPSQTAVNDLSTDEQIAQWLTARAADPAPFDGAPAWRDDRKPHGEVSVGIGTGGYRDHGVALSLPIGESGRLNLNYRQVENGYPYGYGYGYGRDPYFSDMDTIFPGRRSPDAAGRYEDRRATPEGSSGVRSGAGFYAPD